MTEVKLVEKPWESLPATGPLLRPADAARYLGYRSRTHYYNLVHKGLVPKPIQIGPAGTSAVGVPQPWLDAIIAAAAA